MSLKIFVLTLLSAMAFQANAGLYVDGKTIQATDQHSKRIAEAFKTKSSDSFNIYILCDPEFVNLCAYTEAKAGEDINPALIRRLLSTRNKKAVSYNATEARQIQAALKGLAQSLDLGTIQGIQISCGKQKGKLVCDLKHIN